MKTMNLKKLLNQSLNNLEKFNPESIIDKLSFNIYLNVVYGAGDIRDKKSCANYCWFPGFIDILKPKQIVELGSAMGVALVSMLQSQHKVDHIYGVTLAENNLEFCYIDKIKYPNLKCITGNYMDMSIWPKDVDLKKTDFWYIDGLHQGPHVTEQIKLYKPFFKPGTIIAFDDIFMSPDMSEMWHGLDDILDIKYKTTLPLHFTGWGLIQL